MPHNKAKKSSHGHSSNHVSNSSVRDNPDHKGSGMPRFEQGHWQKTLNEIETAGGRYSSEMNQSSEYQQSNDALASYAKKHRMQH